MKSDAEPPSDILANCIKILFDWYHGNTPNAFTLGITVTYKQRQNLDEGQCSSQNNESRDGMAIQIFPVNLLETKLKKNMSNREEPLLTTLILSGNKWSFYANTGVLSHEKGQRPRTPRRFRAPQSTKTVLRPWTAERPRTPRTPRRPVTSGGSRRPSTPRQRALSSAKNTSRPETPQRPRTAANVKVATVCDWSDLSCVVDCSLDDMRGLTFGEDNNNDNHLQRPDGFQFDGRGLTGRMFVREKTTLTKGEQAIIGGIVRNKSDLRVPRLSKSLDTTTTTAITPPSNTNANKNEPERHRDAWLLRHNNYFLEALEGAHNVNPCLIPDRCPNADQDQDRQKSKEWREQGILQTSKSLCRGLSISPRINQCGRPRNGMISDRAGNIVYDPTRDGTIGITNSNDFAEKTGFFVTAQKFRFFKFPDIHLGSLDRDRNREKHDLRKRKIPPIVIPNRQGRVTVKHVVEERTKEEGKKTRVKKAYVDVFLPTAGCVYYPEEELIELGKKAQKELDDMNNATSNNSRVVIHVETCDNDGDSSDNEDYQSDIDPQDDVTNNRRLRHEHCSSSKHICSATDEFT
ncbi:uncharacterized protein LOC144349730 [Saccoglossus kowalevskii]